MQDLMNIFNHLTASGVFDILLFLFFLTSMMVFFVARGSWKKQQIVLLARVNELEEEIHAVSQGAMGMGKRLLSLERVLRQNIPAKEKVEKIGRAFNSMDKAVELISKGASLADITKETGIARAEAELLMTVRSSRLKSKAA